MLLLCSSFHVLQFVAAFVTLSYFFRYTHKALDKVITRKIPTLPSKRCESSAWSKENKCFSVLIVGSNCLQSQSYTPSFHQALYDEWHLIARSRCKGENALLDTVFAEAVLTVLMDTPSFRRRWYLPRVWGTQFGLSEFVQGRDPGSTFILDLGSSFASVYLGVKSGAYSRWKKICRVKAGRLIDMDLDLSL